MADDDSDYEEGDAPRRRAAKRPRLVKGAVKASGRKPTRRRRRDDDDTDSDDDVIAVDESEEEEPTRKRRGKAKTATLATGEVHSIIYLDAETMYDCPICMNTVPGDAALRVCALEASHVTCRLCALKYVRSSLTPGIQRLDCPSCDAATASASTSLTHPGSFSHDAVYELQRWSARVHDAHAEAVAAGGAAASSSTSHSASSSPSADPLEGERPLTADEVLRYGQMCVAFAMKNAGGGSGSSGSPNEREIKCPNPACESSFWTDESVPSGVTCAFCGTPMCSACGAEWMETGHASRTCAQVGEALERDREAAELAASEIGGTFKPCPTCNMGTTHYRGHGCHHITCPRCRGHWCFVCCGPYPCSNGCPAWCKDECDCADCPECRHGKPCSFCVAGVVRSAGLLCGPCHGETPAQVATREAVMKAAREARVAAGWCGPRNKALREKSSSDPSRPIPHVGMLPALAMDLRMGVNYLQPQARAALPAAILASRHAAVTVGAHPAAPPRGGSKVTAASFFAALSNTIPDTAGGVERNDLKRRNELKQRRG